MSFKYSLQYDTILFFLHVNIKNLQKHIECILLLTRQNGKFKQNFPIIHVHHYSSTNSGDHHIHSLLEP